MTVVVAEKETSVSRKITKAKLTKAQTIEVEFSITVPMEKDGQEFEITGETSYRGHNMVHQDLVDAFALLHPHFALLCDLAEIKDYSDEEVVNLGLDAIEANLEVIKNIGVRSFTLGGSGDDAGVTISGFKKLSGGKMINLNTPFIKFNDENDGYLYSIELQHILDSIINEEVILHLDGKIAPNMQPEFDFDNASGDDEDQPF